VQVCTLTNRHGGFQCPVQTKLSRRELISLATKFITRSVTDHLTGLGNRRRFDAHLEALAERPSDGSVGLIIFDIDKLKLINDKYGHDLGDIALHVFAEAVREVLRPTDTICRIGGDEFAVIVIPQERRGATRSEKGNVLEIHNVAERIRGHVEEFLWWRHGLPSITATFGYSYGKFSTPHGHLYKKADQALYRAKKSGRNRVGSSTGVQRILDS